VPQDLVALMELLSVTVRTRTELPLARFTLGAVGASNDANRELVTGIATAARDTLNGIIDQVSRLNPGEGARLVSNTNALPQRFRMVPGDVLCR
jgi:hypothetical protein